MAKVGESRRLRAVPRHAGLARIGSLKSLSLQACVDTLEAPFEARLAAFLDLLYSDEARAGVTSVRHAQALFRTWLELSVAYDPSGVSVLPYLSAVLPFYPEAGLRDRPRDLLSRRAAEEAMRAPFDKLLQAYIDRLFDPARDPGIRDEAHAVETFVTFCRLLKTYEDGRA